MPYKSIFHVSTMLERDVKHELRTVSRQNNCSVARTIADAVHMYLETQSALRRENDLHHRKSPALSGNMSAIQMIGGTTQPLLK